MHLRHASVSNIRSVESFLWELDRERDVDDLAGWHVLLGDNGSGKTSILRAIALALNGPKVAPALRANWDTWLRRTCERGEVNLLFAAHQGWDTYASEVQASHAPDLLVHFVRNNGHVDFEQERGSDAGLDPATHVWSGERGWFCASYGPFRRFSGGDDNMEQLYESHPRFARHLTVFGENVALSRITNWLRDLKLDSLEAEKAGHADGGEAGQTLSRLSEFIDRSNLLPHGSRFDEVTRRGVMFCDANGHSVSVDDLSDGYRSILSLTFEVLRNLIAEFGANQVFNADTTRVEVPGVLLIDEIDVHLHPHWQRRIGHWFVERFPNMQFIVTTHSPLVCQAAERGTIYRLPRPGSEEVGGFVRGTDRDRLLYGNVLDAYETESFGHVPTRSEAGHRKLERLATLNMQARSSPLTQDEQQERESLRMALPTLSRGENIP